VLTIRKSLGRSGETTFKCFYVFDKKTQRNNLFSVIKCNAESSSVSTNNGRSPQTSQQETSQPSGRSLYTATLDHGEGPFEGRLKFPISSKRNVSEVCHLEDTNIIILLLFLKVARFSTVWRIGGTAIGQLRLAAMYAFIVLSNKQSLLLMPCELVHVPNWPSVKKWGTQLN